MPNTFLQHSPFVRALILDFSTESSPSSRAFEKVEIRGNSVVDSETYLFHLTQKPGDPYDPKQAIADFHRLWATDSRRPDARGHGRRRGKIVAYVDERPRVQALDFVGSKELSASTITEKLTEEKAEIPSIPSTIRRRW
jgi:outer membrane protein assembly factor BamA